LATGTQSKTLLVSLILGLIGLGALAGAWFLAQKQITILRDWPVVEAEVLSSEVTHHSSSDDNSTTYGVLITFKFEYDGQAVQTSATRGYTTSSYSSMQAVAERFSPQTRHPIRVNPQRPQDVRFNAAYTFEFFGIPVFVGAFGAIFLLVSLATFRPGKLAQATTSPRSGDCPNCGAHPWAGEEVCSKCGAALPRN